MYTGWRNDVNRDFFCFFKLGGFSEVPVLLLTTIASNQRLRFAFLLHRCSIIDRKKSSTLPAALQHRQLRIDPSRIGLFENVDTCASPFAKL
jgi:hypothetical protein